MHHGSVTPEIAAGLRALRARIDAAKIPPSKLDETINVAVWNIREFGKVRRTEAAIHYLAEILGQFDLVALVELRDNLGDLGRVLRFLGDSWRVVYSDWIADDGGNAERTAFLYDRRAVTFNGLAAEIDVPRLKQGQEYLATSSFWRAPYMCSFRAGNFDFLAIAAHARWGQTSGREAELKLLADWIDIHFASKFVEDHDLIVMGDFNTPKLTDRLFAALASRGLKVPKPLIQLKVGDRIIQGSNLGNDARYDQILHLPTIPENFTNHGGALARISHSPPIFRFLFLLIFPCHARRKIKWKRKRKKTGCGLFLSECEKCRLDFFISDAHIKELFPGKNYTREKFTYQLSDHLPIWLQMKTDIDGFRLEQIVQGGKE